jgi:uncharacterized BrkB/YihY/UPF0761 family membrane protein
MFLQLQISLNRIWDVERAPETALRAIVRKRFLSFSLVVAIGFLLLVSLAVSAAITALADQIGRVIHVPLSSSTRRTWSRRSRSSRLSSP